jgi:predicted nuclease with RNAse H fold/dephospho-CoA kinase
LVSLAKPAEVLFLDIETTGLSRYYDFITLVGYATGGVYCVHVAGDDPGELKDALSKARTLVTFNGTLFDIPFLKQTFDGFPVPPRHIDLRYVAKRAGLTGGQKVIERELGIDYRKGLEDIDGAAAVLLWHRYLRGDVTALRKLIDYNAADILGMCALLEKFVDRSTCWDFLVDRPRFTGEEFARVGWAAPNVQLPNPARLGRVRPSFLDLFGTTHAMGATIVGVDLTGSEAKPSGTCVLRGYEAQTAMIKTDDDIVALIFDAKPELVSIDSPLSLPYGRTRVTDDDPVRREYGIMRVCERTLKRRGINVYPCLLPSMQRLTERGMRLAARLRSFGIPVIESYPGAAQDILNIPRKGAGEQWLKLGLAEFGIQGAYATMPVRHDELDAITSALVGSFFLAGKYEGLGGPGEGSLIIPDLGAKRGPPVIGVSGRISAGKTTVARALERLGFAYTRYSLVIDDEIRSRGGVPDRLIRQQVGYELHEKYGQRWLSERAIARIPSGSPVVIDGLRWPEDVAFFVERFGSDFVHTHVEAAIETRAMRYQAIKEEKLDFEAADAAPVESMIDNLRHLAHVRIENNFSIEELEIEVRALAARLLTNEDEAACPFPSS